MVESDVAADGVFDVLIGIELLDLVARGGDEGCDGAGVV